MMLKKDGFTLIEVFIVIAIVSILAAMAIPQYKNFVLKAKRTEALVTLHNVHLNEMTYFTTEESFLTGTPDFVNTKLGITALKITKGGYTFTNYVGHFSPSGMAIGYAVALINNLDNDPAQDIILIKRKFPTITKTPDGIPLVANDDIYNQTCVETCYPL